MDLMVRDMIIITMVLEVNDVTIAFRFLFKELAGSWRSLQKFFLILYLRFLGESSPK